jgi:hypothetical protein
MDDAKVVLQKPEVQAERKAYEPPQLTLFGQVAAFTQNNVCSANSDSGCSVGGSGMGMNSDRRLKQDIVRVGEHPQGFGLYLFSYRPEVQERCGRGRRFGVMADEVEAICPTAVSTDAWGYQVVRYDLLGIQLH